jgi:hypothetical protein
MTQVRTATSRSLKIHLNTVLPTGLGHASPAAFIIPVPDTYLSDCIPLHFADHPNVTDTGGEIPHSVHIQQINRNSVHNEKKLIDGQFRFYLMEVPLKDNNHDVFVVNEHFAPGCPICHNKMHVENCFSESSWKR